MKKSSNIPYLGRIKLNWCESCNVPLLDDFKCDICNKRGHNVILTPPGDVRPAFIYDKKLLISAIDSQYGKGIGEKVIPPNKIVLLNSIGGLDYIDEIIMDGVNFGIIFFNLLSQKYIFKPKLYAGNLIYFWQRKLGFNNKQIEINQDGTPFIIKGKSFLAPGVKDFTNNLKIDDFVLGIAYVDDYKSKICIAIGKTLGNSLQIKEMINNNYGQIAKNESRFYKLKPYEIKKIKNITNAHFNKNTGKSLQKYNQLNDKDFNLKFDSNLMLDIFKANNKYIQKKVSEATSFIIETKNSIEKPIAVAYSGGKDSLATIKLVYDALGPIFKIFFVDTGLELPEVIENVYDVARLLNMEDKLIIKYAKDKFWDLIGEFGPPARDFRFCCHTLKAQNIMEIIQNIYNGNKVLTFLGQRQYESINRSRSKMIYVNSFIPLQIGATPIKTWNSLLLWLYILNYKIMNKDNQNQIVLPVTSLYFKGHQRLGCYLCPASDISTLNNLRKTHPKMMKTWDDYLEEYKEENQYSDEWLKMGLWRFKNLPPQWKIFIEEENIDHTPKRLINKNEISIKITKGFSPCLLSGYSIKGKIANFSKMDSFANLMTSITKKIEFDDELNIISIIGNENSNNYQLNFFSDGSFFIQTSSKNIKYYKLIRNFYANILRNEYCNQCGTCISICPKQAINIADLEIKIDEKLCISCKKCIGHCPLYARSREELKKLDF